MKPDSCMAARMQVLTIRLATPSDIPQALALSRGAGWNQLASDWQTLMRLSPDGCFALECDSRLAATTTVVCYGRQLAWIGMVLTAPEFRRQGFAGLLLRKALALVKERGIASVQLDATEAGVGLYQRLGFREVCRIERWQRLPGRVDRSVVEPYVPDPELDRTVFGADRSPLLSHLAIAGAASFPGQGYAMGRPGHLAAYFGPCVATSSDAARALLRWFLAQHPHSKIFWDLFPDNVDAVSLAEESAFTPVRRLVRMVLSGDSISAPYSHKEQFAIAGFEFG